MTCSSCKTDGLFVDAHYCAVCYGKVYTERDALKKLVRELTLERDQARAEVAKHRRELDAMKQGKLGL